MWHGIHFCWAQSVGYPHNSPWLCTLLRGHLPGLWKGRSLTLCRLSCCWSRYSWQPDLCVHNPCQTGTSFLTQCLAAFRPAEWPWTAHRSSAKGRRHLISWESLRPQHCVGMNKNAKASLQGRKTGKLIIHYSNALTTKLFKVSLFGLGSPETKLKKCSSFNWRSRTELFPLVTDKETATGSEHM